MYETPPDKKVGGGGGGNTWSFRLIDEVFDKSSRFNLYSDTLGTV